jgi:hypothetical protein
MIVDLDKRHHQFAVGLDGERFAVAQEILIEMPRGFDVMDPEGHVWHPQDSRALDLLRAECRTNNQNCRQNLFRLHTIPLNKIAG